MKVFDRDNKPWLRDALRRAEVACRARKDGERPQPADIVEEAIAASVDTLRYLKDQERGWVYSLRALWPEMSIDREQEMENFRDLLERIKRGEESADVLFFGVMPTPQQVARMDAVLEELPKLMVCRNRRRDWRILVGFARGLEAKVVSSFAKCSKTTAYAQKGYHLQRLAVALSEMYPDLACLRS